MKNVILTGIPRSGTTLTAALIDGMPDTVCLNEPGWQVAKPVENAVAFATWLADDFARIRQKLLLGKPVPDRRSPQGAAATDYHRGAQSPKVAPFIRPGLTKDFTLAIKHNAPYLAALESLVALKRFTIIAVLRHPVEVIHSWRSLNLPVSRGKLPAAAPYWPDLAQISAAPLDLLERQVKLYDLMCRRIHELRSHIHVLPYEQLAQNPGVLSGWLGQPDVPAAGLVRQTKKQVPPEERELIAGMLRKHGEYFACFYPDAGSI